MMHAELVQAATDLIAEVNQLWLDHYDAALASSSDRELVKLVSELDAALHSALPMAA